MAVGCCGAAARGAMAVFCGCGCGCQLSAQRAPEWQKFKSFVTILLVIQCAVVYSRFSTKLSKIILHVSVNFTYNYLYCTFDVSFDSLSSVNEIEFRRSGNREASFSQNR